MRPRPAAPARPVLEITRARLALATRDAGSRLLEAALFDAVQLGASALHIESRASALLLRYRIDGLLRPAGQISQTGLRRALLDRLTRLAGLASAATPRARAGQFDVRIEGRALRVRLSLLPGDAGEDAVLHFFAATTPLGLVPLGISRASAALLCQLGARAHGLLLLTGPPDADVATTLSALLSALQQEDEKIIAWRAPQTACMPGVLQLSADARQTAWCADTLLRHDADTLVCGALADAATTTMALQAALCGQRVLAAMPAADIPCAIARLRALAGSADSLAVAVNAVVSQRAVRRLCQHCAQPSAPDARWAKLLARTVAPRARVDYRRPVGCPACQGQGFKGRVPLLASLALDAGLRTALAQGVDGHTLLRHAAVGSYRPFLLDALEAWCQGLTTVEELQRVLDPV